MIAHQQTRMGEAVHAVLCVKTISRNCLLRCLFSVVHSWPCNHYQRLSPDFERWVMGQIELTSVRCVALQKKINSGAHPRGVYTRTVKKKNK